LLLPSLVIAFEDGFLNDTIDIRVNNKQIYFMQNVSTKRVLGLASWTQIEGLEGSIVIHINVPSKNISERLALVIFKKMYIAISIKNGELLHRVSDEPLGYM
jgi:hypothetical protein